MTDRPSLRSTSDPGPDEVAAVTGLVARAALVDGAESVNEAGLLHLRHPRAGVRHVLAEGPSGLLGYAQLDGVTATGFSTGQLVVDPAARRAGLGGRLLAELLAGTRTPLRLWAVGDTPAARALATSARLVPARTLLVMVRPMAEPVPPAPVPADVVLRPFAVGADEPAWLAVNARAFAAHPEQGSVTAADLAERMAEAWFDPAGFFVAERRGPGSQQGALVGYHWTKQHPGTLGEVYVLGVDPGAGGRGLGRALLVRGLEHLRDRGDTAVQLYVEADHERAVALYTAYGFAETGRDVMYAQP